MAYYSIYYKNFLGISVLALIFVFMLIYFDKFSLGPNFKTLLTLIVLATIFSINTKGLKKELLVFLFVTKLFVSVLFIGLVYFFPVSLVLYLTISIGVVLLGAGAIFYLFATVNSIFKKRPSLVIDRNGICLDNAIKRVRVGWSGVESLIYFKFNFTGKKPLVLFSFIARDGAVATYLPFYFMKEKEIVISSKKDSPIYGDVLSIDLTDIPEHPENIIKEIEAFLQKNNINVPIRQN